MAESGEHRDTDNNNWVIPNTEGLPVETVGYEHGQPLPSHEEVKLEDPEPTAGPETEEPGVQEVKGPDSAHSQGPESPPPITEILPHQEHLEIPPEVEPQSLGEEPSSGLRRRLGGDLEEVSCSSSDDDVEGLRKRATRGAPPTTSIGPAPREAEHVEADAGFTLTLNKCIIAAVALVALAVLVFTGGLGGDEDLPQTVITRSARAGDKQPETIADIKEWLHQHADQFTADPDRLQVMNDLLDKVAKENQEIRHIQANFQAQKEELEALVHGGDTVTPESQQFRLTEENVRLKEALLREETGHLFAKEELQNLQEKVETLEGDNADKEVLTSENTQLKADLEASKTHIEGFLTQKETLVAESQMLRQELDKQRSLVASIRQELEGMVSNTTEAEEEKDFEGRLSEMSNRLAMEAQRSETWEKKYVEHAQKRKELVGEVKKPYGRKEWKKGSKASDSTHGEQPRKPHFKHGKEHGRRWTEDGQPESQHEEWKSKKYEDKQQWREKKHRHGEGEKNGPEDKESDSWKDKGKEDRWKDSSHHPDKHSRHHHGEAGEDFHPRKGQKEFLEAHKHGEDRRREHGDKAHGKDHRHHDHNKFWKKLSDHQYRVPEGCSGLEDCARKDGIDLFNVDLKPVQRKRFEEILQNYLNKSDLSKHLPELVPLLDGFFEGPHFAHHKIRFKDFVDDVEDFLEDLAKKETGNDDLVDDFERFVYTSFFGDAAIKKRSGKKDGRQKSYKSDRQHNPGKLEETSESDLNQTNPKYTNKKNFKVDSDDPNYKPHNEDSKTDRRFESPSYHHDEDGNNHGWKKPKKYDKDAKYHQKNHPETSGHYFNETGDSVHEQKFKKPKYQKDHDHDYRSHHEDHQDRNEGGRHFQHREHDNRQGHHYHNRDRFDTENRPHGKDRHEHKNPSFIDKEEDTEQPFHQEQKPNWKKPEKDAVNEHYRLSRSHFDKHERHHHDHQPRKEGEGHRHDHQPQKEGEGHRHDHQPRKEGEGHRHDHQPQKEDESHPHENRPRNEGEDDHHEHKPWKHHEGGHHEHKPWKNHGHKPWKDGEGHHHEHKAWKQGEGDDHEHKPWKQGEGDHHEHKPWKQGGHDEYKPWKQGEGDHHDHKPWKKNEGDQHDHKPWKKNEGDHHDHKPWKQGEGDDHEHKPWKQGEGDHHEHKPWKQGGHDEYKPWKQGEGDHHDHKPWKKNEGDQHDHKPWKQGEGDHHEHKPWKQGEGDHHEHKPWKQGEGDHHEHKPWKQGDDGHGKSKHYDKSNYDKHDDRRHNPHYGKHEDHKQRPYEDKFEDHRHGSHKNEDGELKSRHNDRGKNEN